MEVNSTNFSFQPEAEVIQRKVGFEFEVQSWKTWQPKHYWTTDADLVNNPDGRIRVLTNQPGISTGIWNGMFTPAGIIRAKPQTTVGLKLEQLATVMEDVFNPLVEVPALSARRQPGRQALTGLQPGVQPGLILTRMGEAPTQAIQAITAYRAANVHAPAPSPKLKSLLALVIAYLEAAHAGVQEYAKGIAPIMARTDFATLFDLLSDPEKQYYGQNNAQEWLALVNRVQNFAAWNFNTPVFAGGIYNADPARQHNQLNALSKRRWLITLAGWPAKGTDLLTKDHFPDRGNASELESLGALGAKTESVGIGNPGTPAPIFELRSIPGALDYTNWTNFALNVFRYIYNINRGIDFKYGENIPLYGM